MALALRTGQPFLHLLAWHPRDVDTAYRLQLDQLQAAEEQARDARFAAARQQLMQQMNGR